MQVALFPLHTVLYPGGPLPLRIFEPRYLDMVSRCLRDEQPFGVLQIREGSETGPASTFEIGTLARITDWYQGSDGILGVTAVGEERFRVAGIERLEDGLLQGDVELLPDDPPLAMPENFLPMIQILDGVLDDLGRLYENLPRNYDDAVWVGFRFCEILPFSACEKQACLELGDPVERLRLIQTALRDVRGADLA